MYNAVLPLRACLRHAADVGLVVGDVVGAIVLPRRRRGRAYEYDERRFLTRQQLARLLAEIPEQWRPLFELLASTGLRISEAIGLRVMDAGLDIDAPCVHVRRAIVNGQLTAPKSRHGRRTIPISLELADRLRKLRPDRGETGCSSAARRAQRGLHGKLSKTVGRASGSRVRIIPYPPLEVLSQPAARKRYSGGCPAGALARA